MLACSTNRQIKQVASVELRICRFGKFSVTILFLLLLLFDLKCKRTLPAYCYCGLGMHRKQTAAPLAVQLFK
jgi:hypothetical protein